MKRRRRAAAGRPTLLTQNWVPEAPRSRRGRPPKTTEAQEVSLLLAYMRLEKALRDKPVTTAYIERITNLVLGLDGVYREAVLANVAFLGPRYRLSEKPLTRADARALGEQATGKRGVSKKLIYGLLAHHRGSDPEVIRGIVTKARARHPRAGRWAARMRKSAEKSTHFSARSRRGGRSQRL